MSHFTTIQTRFYNLYYLEKALNKLDIDYKQKEARFEYDKSTKNKNSTNLIIPQSNEHNIEFCWDGEQYKLVTDMSYWTQSYSVEGFLQKITNQYASEVVIGECKKAGFQPVKFIQNKDGSNTVTLQRWNEK